TLTKPELSSLNAKDANVSRRTQREFTCLRMWAFSPQTSFPRASACLLPRQRAPIPPAPYGVRPAALGSSPQLQMRFETAARTRFDRAPDLGPSRNSEPEPPKTFQTARV